MHFKKKSESKFDIINRENERKLTPKNNTLKGYEAIGIK
jgi:hypothetical protein